MKTKEIVKRILAKVDVNDWFAFGGLALVCTGVAQIYPPAAWITGGLVFMYIGMH